MPKRRPPIELPPTGGRAGDIPPPGAGPPPRPPGEHPAWRLLRGVLAAATWAAMAVLLITGIWLWLEYVPVPDLPAGADPASTLSPQQYDVHRMQGVHELSTWALGGAGVLWLAAIAATSPTSRRLVATGALLALLGGGAAVWTGLALPWDATSTVGSTAAVAPGESVGADGAPALPTDAEEGIGILGPDEAEDLVVDEEPRSAGTQEALAWGHVLGALLVLVGIATAAGLARARRRRPDDDAMPASRAAPRGPARITLPTDVEAPSGWAPTGSAADEPPAGSGTTEPGPGTGTSGERSGDGYSAHDPLGPPPWDTDEHGPDPWDAGAPGADGPSGGGRP